MNAEELQKQAALYGKALRVTIQNTLFPACAEFGLTYQQFCVLAELSHSPGLTAGELSDRTCILRSNFAAVASKLKKRGLLDQQRSSSDRRFAVLVLTGAGEKLMEDIHQWLDARYGKVYLDESDETFDAMLKGYEAFNRLALKLENINRQLEAEESRI